MEQKPQYIKISTPAAVFFSLLLVATSFYSGVTWLRSQGDDTGSAKTDSSNAVVFAASKSNKPEMKFFVMSFCPYGNQAEDAIRPVFDLMGDKVNLQPQYIFDKIDNINTYCQARSGDPAQCATYVENKYFTSVDECKKAINDNLSKCKDEKAYIKAPNGAMYAALHGRQEANQNVREICAWNQTNDKKQWWNFIDLVNKNCSSQNADVCWEDQAKKAGYDTNKITECFNKEAIDLIEKELAQTNQYKVSGSPTLLVNGVAFPPDNAYTADGKGALKMGKVVLTQDKYRTPNAIKESLCASFDGATPKECKTKLAELATANAAASAGGCQ